jgi:tetratricopeptide (TPR) repeat protein
MRVSDSRSERPGLLAAVLLIVASGLAAYATSFDGRFVYDDLVSIVENPHIRKLWPPWEVTRALPEETVAGRPVVAFSLALNHALSGLDPWSYHGLNLAIHLLAAVTLFGIVRRSLLRPAVGERLHRRATQLAFAVALIWVVHPLGTSAVTYIVQRAESLMGLFYLLTLYAVLRGVDSPRRRVWFTTAVLSCALGMATKEVMVTAPLLVLLYDRAFLAGRLGEALKRRPGLYAALASTWLLLAALMAGAPRSGTAGLQSVFFTPWEYGGTQFGVIVHYLRLSLWPTGLCLDYGWPVARGVGAILLPALPVLALVAASLWASWRHPPLGYLGAWFFLILAPTSSVIPVIFPISEHRMYLPLAAVATAGVLACYAVGSRVPGSGSRLGRLAAFGLLGLVVLALGYSTRHRNADYSSEVGLWSDNLAKRPNNARVHWLLANALVREGRLDEAIGRHRAALALEPDYVDAHYNLAMLLTRRGELSGAMRHYREACRLRPDHADAHNNLAGLLASQGLLEEALHHSQAALEAAPEHFRAQYNRANMLRRMGRPEEALPHYREAIRLAPHFAEAQASLGAALEDLGRFRPAAQRYRLALELRPDFVAAQARLAWLLASVDGLGNGREAVRLAEQSVAAAGHADPDLLDTLAAAYAAAGRFEEAVAAAERAVQAASEAGLQQKVAAIQARLALYRTHEPYRRQMGSGISGRRPSGATVEAGP